MKVMGTVKRVSVAIVQATEKREGGRYTDISIRVPFVHRELDTLSDYLGQEMVVDLEPTQTQLDLEETVEETG